MAESKVAFVTGGGGGIGSAICRALAQAGHHVAVADISTELAEAVAAEIEGLGVVCDVADPASVHAAVAQTQNTLGTIAVLVNCAGWDEFRPFLETDEEFQRKVIEINYGGPVRITRTVLPGMVERNWGRVINIASDAGRVGSSLEAVYSGAKGGVIAFTKTIAREMARYNITANSVCPGPTDTPMIAAIREGSSGEKIVAAMTKAVPMRRLGKPEDIAPAVAFLASEEAGFITGQTLSVSGGLTMA